MPCWRSSRRGREPVSEDEATRAACGIAPESLARLVSLFERTADLDRVWLFGSRARGDFYDASDIDLAVEAPRMNRDDWFRFRGAIEALGLLYRVDAVNVEFITEAPFRERVERDRRLFWAPRRLLAPAGEPGAVELKPFQRTALESLAAYVTELSRQHEAALRAEQALKAADVAVPPEVRDFPRKAWEALRQAGRLPRAFAERDYSSRFAGSGEPVPNVCLKVPTGGGKTLLAAASVAHLHAAYYRRATGMVLWIVPNEAIYRQTRKALADRDHPYRQMLNVAGAGRVKLLEKDSPLTRTDAETHLCVMLLMLQSAARKSKETLRFFRDRGNVHGFFPREDDLDAHWTLLHAIPNLDVYAPFGASAEEAARTRGSVIKDSLGNVMRAARPMVVIDEGQHAYSETALATIDGFNPSFVLELSATPRTARKAGERGANILVDVRGTDLQDAQMIKLPINVDVRPWPDWQSCLAASVAKLDELEREARALEGDTARYIRPILLVQVERTGADQTESGLIHANDAEAYLLQLGFSKAQIAVKTSEKDELAQPENIDLLSPACEVRAIVTKQALQEGWDCPFAYVLCALAAGRNPAAMTQLVGRILRQPQVALTGRTALDECYVFCHDAKTADVVAGIKKSLEQEGMGDLGLAVKAGSGNGGAARSIARRAGMEQLRVFLPRVTWRDVSGARCELSYESDVLGSIDWASIDPANLAANWIPADVGIQEQRLRIGLAVLHDAVPEVEQVLPAPLRTDAVFLTRALTDLVPNPWIAWRLVESVLARLRAQGHADERIAASSALLLEQLRTDLERERERLAEAVFVHQVEDGRIEFRLRADTLDYEIPASMEADLPAQARVLVRPDGKLVEKSLFEPFFESLLDNDFERDFACYLDEKRALRWWHRNVARAGYGLQGWRRNRVYPDFVFVRAESNGRAQLVIMETKGAHLANEDTDYKRRLLERLQAVFADERLARAGELELVGRDGESLVCDLVFDQNWRNQLNQDYFSA